jgi:hypothetical protein
MSDPTGPTGPTSFNREPLWWIAAGQGIIQAIFVLLASFNVPITSAQQAAITGLFIVLGTAWGRSKVFAPVDAVGRPIMVVHPEPHFQEARGDGPEQTWPSPPFIEEERRETPRQSTGAEDREKELLDDYKKRTGKK